jgi:chromosome segregation ATPase
MSTEVLLATSILGGTLSLATGFLMGARQLAQQRTIRALKAELAASRRALVRAHEQLALAQLRLDKAPPSEVEQALRTDLAVAARSLADHRERVRRFEQENAQLRQDLHELETPAGPRAKKRNPSKSRTTLNPAVR